MGLTLNISGESSDGPFDFVASVSDMTVERLKQGMPADVPATQGEIVGTTVTVVSQSGATGATGAAGAPGSATQTVQPDLDGLYASDVASETLLKQVLADFSGLPGSLTSVSFSSYVRALGGATGTFRLRVGGTDGVADGTLAVTLTVTSTSYQMVTGTGSITNPNALSLVKLTAQTNTAGLDAQIKSAVAIFT
jgi:hypothetical protein